MLLRGHDGEYHAIEVNLWSSVIEPVFLQHQAIGVIPLAQQIGAIAHEMPALRPVRVAADEVEPHRVAGRCRQNGGEESGRLLEGHLEGVRVHGGDAYRGGIGDHPGVELLRSRHGVHHKGKPCLCGRVEQADQSVFVMLSRHRLPVGPERVGAQSDGVDQPIGGDGVAGRTGRFDGTVRSIAVQPLHQLAHDQQGRRVGSPVDVQRTRFVVQPVDQGRNGELPPVHQVRCANERILESDVRLDQHGAVVEVERDHRRLILHQDAVRLLEVGRPRDLTRCAQL